jgi:uncharacterized protein (DUF1501 family)
MRAGFATRRPCDRTTRRDFLKVGALTAAGLGLKDYLKLQAAGAVSPKARAQAVILLYMGGGASHLDTFDPKPAAPAEYRGTFGAIPSNVPGLSVCEHLTSTARHMDKIAVLRAVHHTQPEHQQAAHYMLTGWMPSAVVFSNEHPSMGSVVAKEQGGRTATPYVVLRGPEILVNRHHGAAFLARQYNPLTIQAPFDMTDLAAPLGTVLADGVSVGRMGERRVLLEAMDYVQRREALWQRQTAGADAFRGKALDMASSPRASSAFDLSREPDRVKARYGRNMLGLGCLLARRLVEAGVRFVTISRGGWDTHKDNFKLLERDRLPELDRALSALLEDLHGRGLLQSTLVIWSGEFGRTPRINKDAGRDHWAQAMSICLAGGGVRGGQAVGASDARAEEPAERPVTPEDVWATMYSLLGIDCGQSYTVPEGFEFRTVPRRTTILSTGNVIPELL